MDEYNDLVVSSNEKLMEPRNRDYQPLTEGQRQELADREAELWEEQARSGHFA